MSDRIYAKFFRVVLEQDEQQTAAAPEAEMSDAQAAQAELGGETQVGALGADMNKQAAEMSAKQQQVMAQKLTGWINELGEMVEYLNGINGESIQGTLAQSIPDTLFDKIKNSESKTIARIAKELAGLQQSFSGYLSTSNNPSYKYV